MEKTNNNKYLRKVLFVCMGNICRSPAAEGILKKYIQDKGLEGKIYVDSAGTIGYHAGEMPDTRMRKAASERGYNLTHRSRKFDPDFDFDYFDYIFYMDNQNFNDITYFDQNRVYLNKILSVSEYCLKHKMILVPDPYYGTIHDFYKVIEILEDACEGIIERLIKEIEPDNKR
ncbi:MAG: low molecular weight protein-tyrosine-phosphatase [Bacteroidota bacterium]|nr:low molecular weight protein-tyrosine-phosphatase [Bacteroidota bacterium]